jgi:hypothetical protein
MELKHLILSRNYDTMIALMRNNVGYIKKVKKEVTTEGDKAEGGSEAKRQIRAVFKIPSCIRSGTFSEGNTDGQESELIEMKL